MFQHSAFAGSWRQAIVKVSLLTLAKILGPSTKWLTTQAYQAMIPVRSRFFSLRFPVGREESGHVGLPARPAGRVGSSAAGDRVGVLAARRQPMLVPALAAVSGAEDLAAPCDAVDLVGIARMESHTHHRSLGLDAAIEAPPAAAGIVAAVERSVRA